MFHFSAIVLVKLVAKSTENPQESGGKDFQEHRELSEHMLLIIHVALLIVFIVATAYEGVFLIPIGSFAGIVFILQSPLPSLEVKLVFLLIGLFCIVLFFVGLKFRASWKGKLLNVASVYLWCLAGYFALGDMYG